MADDPYLDKLRHLQLEYEKDIQRYRAELESVGVDPGAVTMDQWHGWVGDIAIALRAENEPELAARVKAAAEECRTASVARRAARNRGEGTIKLADSEERALKVLEDVMLDVSVALDWEN